MKEELIQAFQYIYGEHGDIRVFFAPGRVNLIGEHTDYNGGHVFPCALDMGTCLAVRKREDRRLRFYSENMKQLGIIESNLDDLVYAGEADWTNYPKGVMWALGQKGYQMESGLDILVSGNIPNGSGLSSSASLEVVTGLAIKELFGFDRLTMIDLALIGQYSENNYNGCNCGIMDQFTVAMGRQDHALFLDTSSLSYRYVPVKLPGCKIVITNSKVKHALVDSAYNDRRTECETALQELQTEIAVGSLGELDEKTFELHKKAIKSPVRERRAYHAVYENQRTIAAVKALSDGDLAGFGRLMNESHISLRDAYEVSCPEIDLLVEQAWQIPGVIGSRITGGGFGGCTVSIVRDEAVDDFIRDLGTVYREKTGKTAEFYVAEIGNGAREI